MDSKLWKNSAFVSSNSIFLVSRYFSQRGNLHISPFVFCPAWKRERERERENRIKRKNKGGRISTSISLRNRWIIGEPIQFRITKAVFFCYLFIFFCFDSTEKWAFNSPSAQFMHVAIVSLIDDKTEPRFGCRFFGRVNRGQGCGQGWKAGGWKSWRHLLILHLGQFREREREREKGRVSKSFEIFFCLFFFFFFFFIPENV